MVPLDDETASSDATDAADAADPEWLDSLSLWRDGLDHATREDMRRVVVSRLDPPMSRRMTGEMDVVSVPPEVETPPAPEVRRRVDRPDPDRRHRSYQDNGHDPYQDRRRQRLPEEPSEQARLLPTTPMLSMTSGRTPTTSGETPVVDPYADILGPTGHVVRRPTPRARDPRVRATPPVRRRRFGRLGVALALSLALAIAWFVLVAARAPSRENAPVDRIGGGIDQMVVDNLMADRLQALVGWVASVSTTLVLGGVIFQLFVAGARALPHARSSRSATGHSAGLAVIRKAAIVGIVAELICIPLRAAVMSSDGWSAMWDADTLRFVMAGRFGDAAFVRIAGLALLAGFLPVLPIGPASRRPGSDGLGSLGSSDADRVGRNGYGHRNGRTGGAREVVRRGAIYPRRLSAAAASVDRMLLERAACVIGGLVILLSYAIVGHPQATRPAALFVPIQCVHIVAVSTWFGGVAFLAIELRQQRREGTARDFAEVVRRFSTVAGVTVALAGVSGLLMANSQLSSLEDLRETSYGRALLVKVLLVAIPVAIGGYNRQRLVPAIIRRDDATAWRHLRFTLLLETGLIAMGVLLATAAMTSGGFQ